MVQLTLKLRLNASASAFVALRETANTYTESFNRVSQVAYYMPRQNKCELHKLTYDTERGACDLPSQLVCSARDKAYEAVKSTLERKKKGKQVSCPRSHNAGIRFDKNSATIKLKEGTAKAKSGKTVLCGRPVNPPIVSSKNQSEPVLKTATSLGTETSFVL
jgi:putative transposase